MNKLQFEREYLGNFTLSERYEDIVNRIRNSSTYDTAKEIMYRITTQQELEKKINELILQRSSLHEHIENLKRLSQDYCVCGSTMDSHYSENHSPISEFENYLQSNEL